MTKTQTFSFEAIIERAEKGSEAAFISVPLDIEKTFGTRGQVKVKALFDGHVYRGVLANMGTGCHILGVRKDVRQAIGKSIGDLVTVVIEQDREERRVEIPPELQTVFNKNAKIKSFFDSLSFTNRKEYTVWINSAKKPETRMKRLDETVQKLSQGKKNPTEK